MAHGFDLNPTRERGRTVREVLADRDTAERARIVRCLEIGTVPVATAMRDLAEWIVSYTRWLNLCQAQGTLDSPA